MSKTETATTSAANAAWLPTQSVLRSYKEAGNSLTALGKVAGVNDSMLSRATTIPGRELDKDTLRRLFPHVEGLREATSRQIAEKMATDAADLGIEMSVGTIDLEPSPAELADGRTMLPLTAIHQSLRINPRKTFDQDYIDELADSIATKGLLENLIVRASREEGRYEIVGGERRFRAITQLANKGAWDADAPNIAVKIVEADDAEARAIALVENLQRVEISPLEEAGAFAELQALDAAHWTTTEIARAIGKDNDSGRRYVLQRLSLVYKLNKEGRDLLEAGTITFEKARFLTQFTPKAQDAICVEIERGDADLHGLFDTFRQRAEAIAKAVAPKPEKAPKAAATASADGDGSAAADDDVGDEPPYRATLPAGAVPPLPDGDSTDYDAADLATGLPDPDTWALQTATPALLTITLQAPSQEAFEAALRLFRYGKTQAATEAA